MNISDTIKSAVKGMPSLVTGGQPGYRAGDDKLAWFRPELSAPPTISIRSEAFEDGSPIPFRYSADGDNQPPPLSWSGLPEGTRSLALIVEDPDAPTPEPFVHWLLYGISPAMKNLSAAGERSAAGGAMQGKNSTMKTGWTGMAPPKGDTPHRYFFQLFALDTPLMLEPGIGRTALMDAMAGHVIARGRLLGTYQRSKDA